MIRQTIKNKLPPTFYRSVLSWWRRVNIRPIPGNLPTGLTPVSRIWGLDRGTSIDHYYLQKFLNAHQSDIRGAALEMGDPRYIRKYGGDRVTSVDVLHLAPGNPEATIVGDLSTGEGIPQDRFDCMIVVNTLPLIYDARAAIKNCYSALKTGGVFLASFHGLSPRVPGGGNDWVGDYWRFTSMSARRLCEEFFQPNNVELQVYGNVRAATAYLYGLAAEELQPIELDYHDPNYELVIGVRARKTPVE